MEPREISLLGSLDGEWFKLPHAVMRDVDSATLTFAGMLKITNKATYVRAEKIADAARIKLCTTRKHLKKLQDRGWIENGGRAGFRRTATRRITKQAQQHLKPYGFLPWWATWTMKWPEQAVLSLVMSRLCKFKMVAVERCGADEDDPDSVLYTICEYLDDHSRWEFSVADIMRDTGLSKTSVIKAKRRLAKMRIVEWRYKRDDSGGMLADTLAPNSGFRAVVTPKAGGMVSVTFRVVT